MALDNSFTDAVLLLEAPLVGYVDYREPGLPDYLGSSRDEFAAEAESVGKVSTASLEQIAALQPDLIISAEVRDGEELRATVRDRADHLHRDDRARRGRTTSGSSARHWARRNSRSRRSAPTRTRAAAVGAEINDTASNPVISVVRFAGEPTARLYRTTSFSGIVLSDAGLARPQSQGPDPADPDNIMQAISPELISEAEGDAIFVSTWQDPARQERRSGEAVPGEPAVADAEGTQGRRRRRPLDVAGQHPGRAPHPRRPVGHVRGGQAQRLT